VTTNRLESVAYHTVQKALRGQSVYIPGVVNRTLSLFGKLVPRPWMAAVIYRRWNKAQSKWLHPRCGA
jgi:hypothetical protein